MRKMQSIEPRRFDLDTHSQDTTKIAEIGTGTDSGVQIAVAHTQFFDFFPCPFRLLMVFPTR